MTLMETMLKYPPGSLVARRFGDSTEPFVVIQVEDHPVLNMAFIRLRTQSGKLFTKEFTADPTFYEEYTK